MAPAASADQTIGADVTQMPTTKGTCAPADAEIRPCVIVTTLLPGRMLTSPCNGTITRFRLNGFVRPNNHYRLRVVHNNGNGTYTGTASSAQVAIQADGINEYATSLPIAAGEAIGIDFMDSTEDFGLRWVLTMPTNSDLVFHTFPADGTPSGPGEDDWAYYLFNADVQCQGEGGPAGGSTSAPSNEFTVLGLKGTTLSVDVKSAGTVAVADGNPPAKRKKRASTSKKGSKPKLLKPSSATGGPGVVKLPLKLTGAAKRKLNEKGKAKVKALVTFTPTGGTAATQTAKLTVKKKRARQ
jgi:hypothetical protein